MLTLVLNNFLRMRRKPLAGNKENVKSCFHCEGKNRQSWWKFVECDEELGLKRFLRKNSFAAVFSLPWCWESLTRRPAARTTSPKSPTRRPYTYQHCRGRVFQNIRPKLDNTSTVRCGFWKTLLILAPRRKVCLLWALGFFGRLQTQQAGGPWSFWEVKWDVWLNSSRVKDIKCLSSPERTAL